MNIRKPITIALTLLALAATADAATLFTPPLSHQVWFGTEVSCRLVNVADRPTKVRIQSINRNGNVDNDSGAILVQPHEIVQVRTEGSGRSYCRFDVMGNPDRVRASACKFDFIQDRCRGTLHAE